MLLLQEKLKAGWEIVHQCDPETGYLVELFVPQEEDARVHQDQARC